MVSGSVAGTLTLALVNMQQVNDIRADWRRCRDLE